MKNSETHSVCNKHNIGDKSVCCECTGKTDCSDSPKTTDSEDWEKGLETVTEKYIEWFYSSKHTSEEKKFVVSANLREYESKVKDFIRETRTAAYEKGFKAATIECEGCKLNETDQFKQGRASALREALEVVKENRKGAFTDDAGNDCWYVDDLCKAIERLLDT